VAAVRTPTAIAVRAVALATAAVLLVSGCGGASSHYVVNTPAQTYFKVPKAWDVTQINGDAFTTREFLVHNAWAVFFAPKGLQPDALSDLVTSTVPLGVALIGQIEQGDYDTFDNLSLRVIPYTDDTGQLAYLDPIDVLQRQDDDIVRIYGLETITRDGLRGYRLRYQIGTGPDTPPLVYDQTKLIYDATHTYYLFRVTCQVQCFSDYSHDIDTIFNSLRVRRDQP
jgi:hypothetical protein